MPPGCTAECNVGLAISRPLFVLSVILLLMSFAKPQVLHQDQEVKVHDLPSLMARTHDPSDVLLTRSTPSFTTEKCVADRTQPSKTLPRSPILSLSTLPSNLKEDIC